MLTAKRSVERVAREIEVLGENLLHCRFSTKNLPYFDLGSTPDSCEGKPATDILSYGKPPPPRHAISLTPLFRIISLSLGTDFFSGSRLKEQDVGQE
jgi:hypothetical protein